AFARLDPARRPGAIGVPHGCDEQVALTVARDILGAVAHRLDLEGSPLARTARAAIAGADVVDPLSGLDRLASRAVEIVLPGQLGSGKDRRVAPRSHTRRVYRHRRHQDDRANRARPTHDGRWPNAASCHASPATRSAPVR